MRRILVLAVALCHSHPGVAQTDAWEVDAGKTTLRLTFARFSSGTRNLAWLTEPIKPPAKAKPGPEHLEFREDNSTFFNDGIVTYVPLANLLSLEYDHDKKVVRALCVSGEGKKVVLTGTTKFVGINKFTVEGELQPATLDLSGGMTVIADGALKTPIRGIRLRAAADVPPAVAAPPGRLATVVGQDKEKSEHPVGDLRPLYRMGASQRRAPVLMFQKIGQLDVGEIVSLKHLPPPKKQNVAHDYEVTLKNGQTHTLTLLEATTLDDNQPAQLIGLVGRVAAGWKLFPPHTIGAVRFEAKQ